jgi:GH43 family beta-xylosidase
VVWTPEAGQPWSAGVWAPELQRWGKKWYIYFAADGGNNESHRIFVLENASADPMDGEWAMKGKVADASDKWAIDPDLFEVRGVHYLIWSGWKGDTNGEQDIFIARMSNPWTIGSPRTLISSPTYPWEKFGDTPRGTHIDVNEGPEALVHDGKVFVFFSASGCWTDHYALGAVVASARANLLDPASWTKFDHPFLSQDPAHSVYAPGHNGFFKSPDGKQDWIIYHANPEPGQGCGAHRSPRMQRFTWNAEGTPNLAAPVAAGVPLQKPQ